MIELARGEGLDVTGRDGLLGTPLGSLSVRVSDGAGAEVVSTYVRLDSAGRGEIPSLKPGSYSIVAGGNGLASVAFDGVPVPGPALAVSLTPGGTLEVDVPAERLKAGPLKCALTGPRGTPLAFRLWGNRGELSISMSSIHLTNFPPVSGTLHVSRFGARPVQRDRRRHGADRGEIAARRAAGTYLFPRKERPGHETPPLHRRGRGPRGPLVPGAFLGRLTTRSGRNRGPDESPTSNTWGGNPLFAVASRPEFVAAGPYDPVDALRRCP